MTTIPPFVSASDASAWSDVVMVDLGNNAEGLDPREAYERGHVAGAVFMDLDRWLAGPPTDDDGRHPLPTPEVFAEGMSEAGIAETDRVVAYDRVGGVFAARFVWMLRALGLEAAVLDGGLGGWSGELATGSSTRTRTSFPVRAIPDAAIAEFDEVLAYVNDLDKDSAPSAVLLDARERHRFEGEAHPLDAVSGHIPGARSLPCREHLDDKGQLLPVEVLRERAKEVGVTAPDTPVISSCGSGVTACHNLLVLEHIGLGTGRLYPGSWSQWSMSEAPIVLGASASG